MNIYIINSWIVLLTNDFMNTYRNLKSWVCHNAKKFGLFVNYKITWKFFYWWNSYLCVKGNCISWLNFDIRDLLMATTTLDNTFPPFFPPSYVLYFSPNRKTKFDTSIEKCCFVPAIVKMHIRLVLNGTVCMRNVSVGKCLHAESTVQKKRKKASRGRIVYMDVSGIFFVCSFVCLCTHSRKQTLLRIKG